MRMAVEIELTEADRKRLQQWSRSRSVAVRLRERSRMVLMAADGMTNKAIAEALGIDQNKVGRWRRRFADDGLKGIATERRQPRGQVLQGASEAEERGDPSDDAGRSSRRDALVVPVDGAGGGDDTQLRAPGVAVVRTEAALGADLQGEHGPALRGEAQGRGGAVPEPAEQRGRLQLRRDEFGSGAGPHAARLGAEEGPLRDHDARLQAQRHHVALRRPGRGVGQVIGETYKRHRHQEVLKFLWQVDKAVPKDQQIHIILDNYATHKHAKVIHWIERQKRIFLHFTPTSASWLNLVERFFSTLTQKQLRRGVFHSVKDLEMCLKDYIETLQPGPETSGLDEVGEQNSRKGGAGQTGAGRRFCIITILKDTTLACFP